MTPTTEPPAQQPSKDGKVDWGVNGHNINWANIVVSAPVCNPVKKGRNLDKIDKTKLEGLKVGDTTVPTASISLDGLRKIGIKLGITGSQSKTKMAEALVAHCASKEQQKLLGVLDQ